MKVVYKLHKGAHSKPWEEMCLALRMMPQRSRFLWNNAGAGIELHGRLQHQRTQYSCIITRGRKGGWACRNDRRMRDDSIMATKIMLYKELVGVAE